MLRPHKVRHAVRRRWFERRAPQMQMREARYGLIDMGSSYGGWLMPQGLIEASWVCYCVGAGGDISFDLELIDRYGARIRSIDAVEDYVRLAREQAAGASGFSVHHAAIASVDGPVRMQVTHDEHSSSVPRPGCTSRRTSSSCPAGPSPR